MDLDFYRSAKKVFRWIAGDRGIRPLAVGIRSVLHIWYYGHRHGCPCCRAELRRFVEAGELCPACGAGKRQRLQWLYLEREHDFFNQGYPVLDMAPMWHFQRYCTRKTVLNYRSADLESPLAMDRVDLTRTNYADEEFQVVLCSHVLEHIPDDRAAMVELHRITKAGGFVLIQVPLLGEVTDEDPNITGSEERLRRFGQEDHVRIYGLDLQGRLEAAGFRVELNRYAGNFTAAEQQRLGLDPEELLIICSRNRD